MNTQIPVPHPPDIVGLSFRSIIDDRDAEALYAIHTGRIVRDRVDLTLHHEDFPKLDQLRHELRKAVESELAYLWLVAQVQDQVVGYSQVNSWHEEDGVWVYFIGGWILPEWRGKGIGTAMLHWGEALSRQLAGQHPNDPFEYAANASCTELDSAALLRNEGYSVAFTTLEMQFNLAANLPVPPPLPEGIQLRPVLPEHHPQIVSSIIECYVDSFPGGRFRTIYDRVAHYSAELRELANHAELMYVAWDGDQVAGQVFVSLDQGQACVSQVSVRKAWRRRGLARALMIRALRDVTQRGEKMVWLDTFAEYQTRAVDLYRELGFFVAKEYMRYRKPG